MAQAWLQVIGLVVEFVGVVLLAWEWFTAQRQDAAERSIEADHARREESMARLQQAQPGNPAMQRHFDMSRDMQRRMTESRTALTRQTYGGMRANAVRVALLFLVLGFVVQLAGAWPGCCRFAGIVPAG